MLASLALVRTGVFDLGWGLSPTAALERAERAPREERLGILRCLAEIPVVSAVRTAALARLNRVEQGER